MAHFAHSSPVRVESTEEVRCQPSAPDMVIWPTTTADSYRLRAVIRLSVPDRPLVEQAVIGFGAAANLARGLDRTYCARQTCEPSTLMHLNVVSVALALTYIPQAQRPSDY